MYTPEEIKAALCLKFNRLNITDLNENNCPITVNFYL